MLLNGNVFVTCCNHQLEHSPSGRGHPTATATASRARLQGRDFVGREAGESQAPQGGQRNHGAQFVHREINPGGADGAERWGCEKKTKDGMVLIGFDMF